MLEIGQAAVEVENGAIHNGFKPVELGNRYEVLVPTLVLVDGEEQTEMFDFSTERLAKRSRQLRIMAQCICTTCDQLHLADKEGRRATEFFRPQDGLRLGSEYMPSVISHSFGLILSMMGDVPNLYAEVSDNSDVGRVKRVA